MDTKLTKKYTIIFLLILNIFLLSASILLEEKYKITKNQIASINVYLQNNDIKLYADLPKKYEPMPKIRMKKTKFDENILKKIFFEDNANIDRIEQFENILYKQKEKTLLINNANIYFSDLEVKENFDYSKSNCIKSTQTYKELLEEEYGKMELDRVVQEENYFNITYIQKSNKYKNFNNILYFIVYKDGKMEGYFNNYKEVEISSQLKNICSSDEALYTFAKEISKLIEDESIYIRQIDLGYYRKDDGDNIAFSFIPYYRIYIKESEMPFYINAYTNTFEYEAISPILPSF